MLTRRELIRLGLGSLLLGPALPACRPRGRAPAPRASTPNLVLFHLGGGVDAAYTTDPKTRAEVEADIDVPQDEGEILELGAHRFGPHLAAMAPWAGQMAIINGVQVHTAGHYYGTDQYVRLRTNVHAEMPLFCDVVGAHRGDQPLAEMSLWESHGNGYSPKSFRGDNLFARIDELAAADFDELGRSMMKQADAIGGQGRSPEARNTAANIRDSARLFERLAQVPRFSPVVWAEDPLEQAIALRLQRVLWGLQHRLVATVLVGFYRWDSHQFNAQTQAGISTRFFSCLSRFCDELSTRSDGAGTLAEKTLLVLGSELGRFPRVNETGGKDHFPEVPMILMGPGLRPGVYGGTGRRREAVALSVKSGRPEVGGRLLVQLEDVGSTVLRLCGLDPRVYGYNGQALDFLLS